MYYIYIYAKETQKYVHKQTNVIYKFLCGPIKRSKLKKERRLLFENGTNIY